MKLKTYVFIIIGILFLIPINVFASDGETTKLFINYDILKDGSIKVSELAVLEPDYNGRLRNLAYKGTNTTTFTGLESDFEGSDIYNGSSIQNLKIYDITGTDNLTFKDLLNRNVGQEYQLVSSANNGQLGVYQETLTTDGVSLKIFNPSTTGKSFYMEYIVKDVVVVHNDVAEIAWNILGTSYEDNIEYMETRVNLPSTDESMRVWLRGPLNGNIERVDNKYAKITYNFLGARNAVSFRVMFDKSLVPTAIKSSGVDGKSKILAVEQKAADAANKQREQIKFQNNLVIAVSIIWLVAFIILFVLTLLKKKKSDQCDFDIDYYREFPGQYGPEVLEKLLNNKISTNGMSASILNIINKDGLDTKEDPNDKHNFIFIKNVSNYDKLQSNEKILVNLIIDTIGDGNQVSLNEIKKYGKSVSNANKFIDKYNEWKKETESLAITEDFFQKSVPIRTVAVLVSFIGILMTILNTIFETGFILGYLCVVIAIVGMIFLVTLDFRTPKGALHYKQWMAFKNFLKDFGTMDEKQLPELIIWEKYLVYATVLGCAKQLEKDMKIRMQNIDLENDQYNSFYRSRYYTRMYMFTSFSTTVNSSMNQAVASSRSSIASSNSSSGGGFGGGASMGGGSFGGGGGGGHF